LQQLISPESFFSDEQTFPRTTSENESIFCDELFASSAVSLNLNRGRSNLNEADDGADDDGDDDSVIQMYLHNQVSCPQRKEYLDRFPSFSPR
jgi:hypothetical protein